MTSASSWRQSRLSRHARILGGRDFSDVADKDGAVPVYGSGGRFAWACRPLYSGSGVIFGRKGTIDQPRYVSGDFWVTDTAYFVEPIHNDLDAKYLYYWARNFPFDLHMTDTALPSMTSTAIGGEAILLPDIASQRHIVDYLDHETAEIDSFISDYRKMLDLLQERRRAKLNVTLESIDASPVPLKRYGTMQSGLTLGKEYRSEATISLPYLRVANVQAGTVDLTDLKTVDVPPSIARETRLAADDVLITEGGDRDKLGRGALWEGKIDPILHQNHVFAFRCGPHLDAQYLVYILEGREARTYFDITARQSTNLASTNSSIVMAFPVRVPDRAEQSAVVAQLDDDLSLMREEDAELNRGIALAKERRAALITAAVTGQIDVTAKNRPAAEQLEDDIKELS